MIYESWVRSLLTIIIIATLMFLVGCGKQSDFYSITQLDDNTYYVGLYGTYPSHSFEYVIEEMKRRELIITNIKDAHKVHGTTVAVIITTKPSK